ncbi:MAG: c-type cytochrome [Candidatus Kapaibacterium sp.]
MNVLEQFVIPPTQEHVGLLTVMQILSLLTFLPFAGLMLGASVFSVYFNKKGKKTGNALYGRIAKDIIDKLTVGKAAGFALGILPLITIVLVYAQMLYGAKVISTSLLFLSLIIYIVAFIFIYNYKSAFQFETVINSLKGSAAVPEEALQYEKKINYLGIRYGNWGIAAMFIASFLFVGSTTIAAKPGIWSSVDNILKIIISAPIWFNYLFFLAASFAITGGAMLYFFFVWQGGVKDASDDYKDTVKKIAVSSALIGSLVQPVFIFAGTLSMPAGSSSSGFYAFAGFTLLAILIVCNLLYYVYKNSDLRLSGAIFFLMFFVFTFAIVKDQLAFRNAVKDHLLVVNAKADELAKDKQGSIVQVSAADGEKIYNEKCIACHKFDVKLVGPPYKETVPKYSGDLKKLASYIYSPVKIDPSYPAMPNQGLKMKEAEAVAKYLMDNVGKK